MFKSLSYVLAAGVALLAAQVAGADDDTKAATAKAATTDNETLFEQLDKNSDGQVAEDEIPQEKRRLLRRLLRSSDKDANGKLSREEFVEGLKGTAGDQSRGEADSGPPRPRNPDAFNPEALFRRMDQNGDGKVTLDEVPEPRREFVGRLMERADANGDKALTLEEFGKARDLLGRRPGQPGGPPRGPGDGPPPPGDIVFRAIDADGDGTITANEMAKAGDALKKLDKDGDGKLTRRELMPQGPEGGGRPEGRPEAAARGEQLVRRLMQADKNGDGKLSRDEMPERLQRAFDRLDSNSDGSVSAEELKAGAEVLARLRDRAGGDAPKKRPNKQD